MSGWKKELLTEYHLVTDDSWKFLFYILMQEFTKILSATGFSFLVIIILRVENLCLSFFTHQEKKD